MYDAPRTPNLSIGFMPSGGSATAQKFKEKEEQKNHPNYTELDTKTGMVHEYTWNSSKQAYDVKTYPQGAKLSETIQDPNGYFTTLRNKEDGKTGVAGSGENYTGNNKSSDIRLVGESIEDKPKVENPDIVDTQTQTNTGIAEAYNESLAGLPGYDENKNLVENIIGTGESALEGVDDMAGLITGKDSLLGSLGTLIQNMINDPETYWDYFRNGKANEYNYKINQETNAANLQIAQETNATNKDVADQNLGFQRELQEYNKALQDRIFEREDTSYQRTAQDMINAGLNPLSMQGTNGAGEIISQSPLHNEYQAQQSNPMQSFQYQAGGLQTVLSTFASLAQSVESMFTGRQQRDLLQTQIDKQQLENIAFAHKQGIAIVNPRSDYKGRYSVNQPLFNDTYGYGLREEQHKKRANIYDSDLREERILTALEDWMTNGRLEHFMDSMTDSGQKLLNKIFSK